MFTVIHGNQQPDSSADLPTSPGIRAGDFVFLSAQFSSDEDGRPVCGTVETETRGAFDNVKRVLSRVGLDLSHIVQVRCYLADREDVAEFNRVYREIFSEPFPVRTTLAGCLPCDGRIAVDVVAFVGGNDDK